jgi:large subunit ribosomal protein L9
MKVILREEVKNLGKVGEVVKVAPGYARNYLIPKKLAVMATEGALKTFEIQRKAQVKRDVTDRNQAAQLAAEIGKLTIRISRRAGESGALYGSVTSMDIAEALLAKKVAIDRRKIHLEEPIKSLGESKVPIKLHREVTAELRVVVEKAEEHPATNE